MMTVTTIRSCAALLAAVCWIGCSQQQPSSSANNADTTDKTLTALPDVKDRTPAVPDTQFIIVDSTVNIRLGNDTVPRRSGAFDSTLAAYWLQYYNSTKQLPKFLRFKYQGTVMMGARGSLMDAVVIVQDSLKAHIAQDKYQQAFSALTPQQQQELQQAFPILFQTKL
jgi:hypothetical protein